jgi:hypothetical protein
MLANGAFALDNGLSPLPHSITIATTFPLAYWKTAAFAEVMSLGYAPDTDGIDRPKAWDTRYERADGAWHARSNMSGGDWRGALGPPGSMFEPDGCSIWWGGHSKDTDATEGRPAYVVTGWHTPNVAQISLVQESGTVMCEANGHYGAWVIGTERQDPWTIEAHDGSGQLIGSIEGPRPPETPIEVIHVPQADLPHSSSGQMEMLAIERYENSVNVDWAFRFLGGAEALLTTDGKARLMEELRARSLDSPTKRDESHQWARLAFLLQLTIADDLGTEYVRAGGSGSAGSASDAVAHWSSRFRPPIPEAASLLTVRNGDMEIPVSLQ